MYVQYYWILLVFLFVFLFFFFFKTKTAYEFRLSLVGSEICLRDRPPPQLPGSGRGVTRFLAVADTGSGDGNQRALGGQMAVVHRRRPVDLVVLGGDNIYPSGDMALIEATFRKPYAELLAAGVPFHAVLGNHDIRTANGNPQVAYKPFGMKGRYYTLPRRDVASCML